MQSILIKYKVFMAIKRHEKDLSLALSVTANVQICSITMQTERTQQWRVSPRYVGL